MKQKFYVAGFVAFALLSALLLSVMLTGSTVAQSDVSNYDNVRTSGYVIAGTTVTAGTDVIAGDDVTLGGHLGMTPATTITVGYQGTITPTGGLQYLTSTANRGTRLVVTTTLTAGTIQAFYNSGSNTITLTDTAPLVLGGNAALGPGDTLVLFHNGTSWVQLSKTDN